MKRPILLFCATILALVGASNLHAQHPSSTPRSEQFILDSMQLAVEMVQTEIKQEMYTDSLEIAQKIELEKIYSREENLQYTLPIVFFGAIVLIVWISLHFSRRKQRDRYHIIEKAIEMGAELPEGIFDEPQKKRKSWINTLRNGVVTLGCGLGIIVLGLYTDEGIIIGIASIPSFIGLGYLLVALLEYREEKRQKESTTTPTTTSIVNSDSNDNEIQSL